MTAAGASQAEVDSARVRARRIFDVVRADTDSATTAARLRAVYEARGVKGEDLVARIEPNTMPWFRDLARYDPLPLFREVEAPVFVLFGTKDLMVPPEQHASSVRTALAARSKGDATVRVLDGLNHWMQPAETGRPSENIANRNDGRSGADRRTRRLDSVAHSCRRVTSARELRVTEARSHRSTISMSSPS